MGDGDGFSDIAEGTDLPNVRVTIAATGRQLLAYCLHAIKIIVVLVLGLLVFSVPPAITRLGFNPVRTWLDAAIESLTIAALEVSFLTFVIISEVNSQLYNYLRMQGLFHIWERTSSRDRAEGHAANSQDWPNVRVTIEETGRQLLEYCRHAIKLMVVLALGILVFSVVPIITPLGLNPVRSWLDAAIIAAIVCVLEVSFLTYVIISEMNSQTVSYRRMRALFRIWRRSRYGAGVHSAVGGSGQ